MSKYKFGDVLRPVKTGDGEWPLIKDFRVMVLADDIVSLPDLQPRPLVTVLRPLKNSGYGKWTQLGHTHVLGSPMEKDE